MQKEAKEATKAAAGTLELPIDDATTMDVPTWRDQAIPYAQENGDPQQVKHFAKQLGFEPGGENEDELEIAQIAVRAVAFLDAFGLKVTLSAKEE